jgi:ATP-dependent Clp endopeptidase proteolytic subunit ClpP
MTKTTNRKFWEFKASADGASGDLLIYGDISDVSWWEDDVTPSNFARELKDLGDISTLNVYINSYGGDAFAGQAIHSQLKRHKAQVNVYIDGIAASAASIIAMAGDKVIMPKNAMLMIHNPWTFAYGYSSDLRKTADMLDKIRDTLVNVYEDKTGLEQDKIIELLDAETWLTAEEAKEMGFADSVDEAKEIQASLSGGFINFNGVSLDASKFRNVPRLKTAEPPMAKPKEEPTMELTKETLASEHKDIYDAVKAEGVKAERERIKALNGLICPGSEAIVAKAIDEGTSPEAASMEIVKAFKNQGAAVLNNLRNDAQDANAVPATPTETPSAEDEEAKASYLKAFKDASNDKRK